MFGATSASMRPGPN